MFMLARNGGKLLGDAAQQLYGGESVIDIHPVPVVSGNHPPDHQAVGRVDIVSGQVCPDGACFRQVNQGGDLRTVGAGADHVRIGPASQQEIDRMDDDRLARPGFPA